MVFDWSTVFGIFGIIGTIAAIVAVGYAIRQTHIAQEQTAIANDALAREQEREREENVWQQRHEAIANKLVRIGPHHLAPGGGFIVTYPTIFRDPAFRAAVENYIV